MSTTPTNVNLDDIQPPPKPDAFNVEWQADVPVPDPNSPGNLVRNVSACYRVPQVGGVVVLTADYQLSDTDSGLLLIANSSSPITFTLPLAVPNLPNPQGVWNVTIKNIGTGVLTVDPNGLNLDGSASTQTVATGSGYQISTDGTDYWKGTTFSVVNFAEAEVPTGSINGSNTSFTIAHTPLGTPIIEEDGLLPTRGAGSFGYTLTGTALVFTDPPVRSVHLWYRY